ncbi:SWIM zinc finger family protein [Paenibacillus arenilitoris]|uniref:SWIM zinc finger family protein n=1 Tax=Paenibacillus arenilitoris TaxID=2772299 RepID=A0A927H4A7_9BACL|nr:SWIM zinc finger family protein [Paenibacillus arenilitoris]MBD2867182.1 SWIM zinc finger family protein [Paenibacillus arenilitoris]
MEYPFYKIDQVQWAMLVSDVAEQFDRAAIARGNELYTQRRVDRLAMPAPRQLEAVVEDDGEHRVQFDLDFFAVSSCSCGSAAGCAHMLAALLEYARVQQRSPQALIHAGEASQAKPAPKRAPQRAIRTDAPPAKHGPARSELQMRAARAGAMSAAEWHELFALCVSPLSDRTRNLQYAQDALTAIAGMRPEPALPPARKQLYELHSYLFLLAQLTAQAQGTFIGYSTRSAAEEVGEAVVRFFQQELPLADEPECRPLLMETLAYVRERMLAEPKSGSYFWGAYDRLWTHWLVPHANGQDLYREELDRLQEASERLGAALSRYPWLLARAKLHFRLAQDREALSCMEELASGFAIREEDLLALLERLLELGQPERLCEWLTAASPLLDARNKELIRRYSGYWDAAVRQLPEAEPGMWDALAGLLPHAAEIYGEKLLAYGKWRHWMDYRLSTGSEPLEHDAAVLATIEKQEPRLLLPYYHQAVERAILLKNKEGYAAAAKLLGRLEKLYAGMNDTLGWDRFMASFAKRHSRLRALQEELRKGEWIE